MTSSIRKLLDLHLATWLGTWPPDREITVSTAPGRSEPGWDGSISPVIGIQCPAGTVISVPPDAVETSIELAEKGGIDALSRGLAAFVPFPEPRLFTCAFRWAEGVADLPDAGEWVSPQHPDAPEWLRPYQEALVAWTPDGCAGAVGIKHHTPYGHELAIRLSARVAARHGLRGLGIRLGSQAARKVLAEGVVPMGIFTFENKGSERLWAAQPSAQLGWQFITMVASPPSDPPTRDRPGARLPAADGPGGCAPSRIGPEGA